MEPESIKARLAQKEIEEWEKYKKNLITEVIKMPDKIMLEEAGERIYCPLLYNLYAHKRGKVICS